MSLTIVVYSIAKYTIVVPILRDKFVSVALKKLTFPITDVIRDMKQDDYASTLLPNVPIQRMMVMNHDPVAGITCSTRVFRGTN